MAFSNPEKKVQTTVSIESIILAIKQIPSALPNVKLTFMNEDFGFYVLETTANGINLGAILEIHLSKEDGLSFIHFTCRRKVDFINMHWEYEDCQNVIRDCMRLMSKAFKGELVKK